MLEGKTYKARLVNQKFDERKYPGRSDILQIRYNPQSDIAERLRTIFAASYKYILEQRNSLPENQRKFIKVPEEQKNTLLYIQQTIQIHICLNVLHRRIQG